MDLRSEKIQRVITKYKFHDVALEELDNIENAFPGMIPSVGRYTFNDGSQKELLKLNGNLPVKYEGRSYNFPIQLWLIDSFPVTPPICLLRPTPDMIIREGKHVDAKGRIYLPILHNWDHPKSSVVALLEEMICKFQEDPPLASSVPGEKNPQELLAFVNNLRINDSTVRHHDQPSTVRQHDQPFHKVSVVGGGDLGMAAVMSILAKCKVDKVVFIDVAESSTKGGSTDLEIFKLPKIEVSKDLSASRGSRVIVVTANAWSGEQSYVSVVQTNVDLFRGIIPTLAQLNPSAVMIIASQPVDVMTHIAWRQSGLPPTQVIGAGCNLDSERLSYILNISLNAHKQAWVIGEHSDNKVPVMSNNEPGSKKLLEITGLDATKPLLGRAFDIMKNQGQRSWSVGLSVADITNSILTDRKKVHSITTLAQGWSGIGAEVFLSLPCLLGSSGSMRLAGVSLGKEEDSKLKESIKSLTNLMSQLRI
ncbi:ubiquitin-conjugating enzyme E2 variant 3 [Syngnathus scovelli]|uniref:ubiquitin-conjugating enzyme E2 variant 3 n=1 Tax=Syngnathus scovelli TaxID=161590 RepID=UPI002110E67D|nr:ubiquitin-conjugating enzyme E2 variant 3 [Syngnathus scovelli]